MIVTSVATAEGSSSMASAAQTWVVAEASGQAPRRFFRRVLYLRFAADSHTGGFLIDDQASSFKGAFAPHDYDALHPDEPSLRAQVSTTGAMLVFQLDGPREVRQVVPAASYSVELSRVDAGKPAVAPTVTTPDGNIGPPGFTDIAFAAQLKLAGNPVVPLASNIAHLNLRSYPTGPRIGIADPALTSVNFFWHADGEIRKSAPASAGTFDTGSALAKALGAYLDSAWLALQKSGAPLPGQVEAAVVVQSDAPCELQIANLQVTFHCLLAAGDKQFLRFAGDRVRKQQVALALPGKPAIVSASVRALDSFQPQVVSTSGAEPDPLAQPDIVSNQGVRLSDSDGRSAAQVFTPPAAVSAGSFLIGVMALTIGAELTMELRQDAGGTPSGATPLSAKLTLGEPGRPQWVMALLPKPALIPSEAHWLVLRAGKGSLVWLTEAEADAVQIGAWQGAQWNPVSVAEGVRALYRVVSAVAPAAVPGQPQAVTAPWRLSIAAANLAGVRGPEPGFTFDLTTPLNAYLQASGSSVTEAPVVVTTAAKGGITIYPPHIVYDP